MDALAHAERDCLESRFRRSASRSDHLIRTEFSGTTAVICIIRGHVLLTLNVGDSRHYSLSSFTQSHSRIRVQ